MIVKITPNVLCKQRKQQSQKAHKICLPNGFNILEKIILDVSET